MGTSTADMELNVLKGGSRADAETQGLLQGITERSTVVPSSAEAAAAPTLLTTVVDLRAYVNRSGVCVPLHFSAMRAFVMFRSLGLRHLPVVDEHNRVVGIVTRKELLNEGLSEKLAALGIHVGH
jgi:CBS domain-containing protein